MSGHTARVRAGNDRASLYTEITDKIITELEAGRIPWVQPWGMAGPRIHDLRHSFVVNRILQWYRAGINPQEKLPFLATYLGHRDIHSTLVYITVTQEILQEANEPSGRSGHIASR